MKRLLPILFILLISSMIFLPGCSRKVKAPSPFAEVHPELWPAGIEAPDSAALSRCVLPLTDQGNNAQALIQVVSIDLPLSKAAFYDPSADSVLAVDTLHEPPHGAYLIISPKSGLFGPFLSAIKYSDTRFFPDPIPWPNRFDGKDMIDLTPIRSFAVGALLAARATPAHRLEVDRRIASLGWQMFHEGAFLTELQTGMDIMALAIKEQHAVHLAAKDSLQARQADAALLNVLGARQRLETQSKWLFAGNMEAAAQSGTIYRQIVLRCAYLISRHEKPVWLHEVTRPLAGAQLILVTGDSLLAQQAGYWLDSLAATKDPFVTEVLPAWRKLSLDDVKAMMAEANAKEDGAR